MILKKIDNTQTKPRLVSINPLHYLCTKQRKRKVEQDFLNSLNDQQREAVLYTDGPELVIAGAGSGKTRVLTYKIAHLLQMGYPPYRLLALTFTNKAANEMKERIAALVGTETAQRLWAGTFHSIFSRILRANADRLGYRHDFTIYDSSDSLSLIKSIIRELQLDDKTYKPTTVQAIISMRKTPLSNRKPMRETGNLSRWILVRNGPSFTKYTVSTDNAVSCRGQWISTTCCSIPIYFSGITPTYCNTIATCSPTSW